MSDELRHLARTSAAIPRDAAIPGYLAGLWRADPAASTIAFAVRQLLMTTVRGRFTRYDVTIATGEDPLDSSVEAIIELASVDTGNARRDEHLRSATFFDVAEQPTARYRSTGIRRAGFSATAQLNRGDFGIDRWIGGGAVVSDEVAITLEIEAVLHE